MRDDFDKVLIERPRSGSRNRNLKTGWHTNQYNPDDEYPFPKTASSSWNWNPDRKHFNDLIGPLQCHLNAQVGRPWRKVEAELMKGLDRNTITGRHLWDHARAMVETKVRMTPDGRPMHLTRNFPVRGLYVHPRTGIIKKPKPYKSDPAAAFRKRVAEATKVVLDANVTAEKVKDLWYLFINDGRTEEVLEARKNAPPVRVQRPILRKKQANTEELRRIRAALEESLKEAPLKDRGWVPGSR